MWCIIDWWCNVLLPRVPNRVTGTCSQTLNLRHWRIFFLLSICYPLTKMGNICIDTWSRMAVIMAQGLFHLKRNVGAFVGSWYSIEGQFLLKTLLTTLIMQTSVYSSLDVTFVMHAFAQVLSNASTKWSRFKEKYHKPNRLTDNQKSRCLEIVVFVSINLYMALFRIYNSIITNI